MHGSLTDMGPHLCPQPQGQRRGRVYGSFFLSIRMQGHPIHLQAHVPRKSTSCAFRAPVCLSSSYLDGDCSWQWRPVTPGWWVVKSEGGNPRIRTLAGAWKGEVRLLGHSVRIKWLKSRMFTSRLRRCFSREQAESRRRGGRSWLCGHYLPRM